ncbi:hypothetical protein LA080_010070 [Diaporthe eres]|uniref:EthD domain-containing protein n=1 Tax=Diaporthe vaccinii TaxID=105482 RepID=A0ABR4ECT8_9PEZI|nr:hypothetical protein LA080_010070 [Diaporthe eres]
MAAPKDPIQEKRLLRLTIAHYRQQDVDERDFHRWVTEGHAALSAKLHARNGVEGFSVFFNPKSFRDFTAQLNMQRGSPWVVRDYDVHVEYLFRDMSTLYKGLQDPEFQVLVAQEGPWISPIHAEVSLGWVETYISEGQVVNIGADGKPSYPGFEELSVPPTI